MGNRAVIAPIATYYDNGIGIYVHWNGGLDSVTAFLKYCEIRGFRTPETDSYGMARLAQVISNFMGGEGLSIGIDTVDKLDCDNWDNGVYLTKGWKIVGRIFVHGKEQLHHDLMDMLISIDEAQPANQQLGEAAIRDLIAADMDIDRFASMYHYNIERMAEKKVKPAQFVEGQTYKGHNEDLVKVVKINEHTIDIELNKIIPNEDYTQWINQTIIQTVPYLHWINGHQSLCYYGRENTTSIYDSHIIEADKVVS